MEKIVRFFYLEVTREAVLIGKTDRRNAISIYISLANSFTSERERVFRDEITSRHSKFLPNRDSALFGMSPSLIRDFSGNSASKSQACKLSPMAATLFHQNRKRKNREKIQTPTPGSTILNLVFEFRCSD